jgi:CBS domain containing-hemolysin-like protein
MVWIALLLLLIVSGVVSAAETALFNLSPKTLREFERIGGLHSRAARLMRHPHKVLMTVLLANTVANLSFYAVSILAIQGFARRFPGAAAGMGVAVLLSVIVVGELIPKGVALANAKRIAPAAAGLLWLIQLVFGPVQWILSVLLVNPITRLMSPARPMSPTVTTEELRLLVEHSARHGHLDSAENEMLQAIVGLTEASVRDIMTPRVDIEWVQLSEQPARVREKVQASKKRVFPSCGKDLDDVRGLLKARDVLLSPHTPWWSLVRPVQFVPEQINISQLMRHFREGRSHIAIVVDEYGGTAGLVTSEDAVEWIVGDLPDEDAGLRAPPTERLDDNTYLVAGDLSVREWTDRFGVQEIDAHIDTVGGLILARLGRLPLVGDRITLRNLTLTVEIVRGRRIERVRLHRDTLESQVAGDDA